MNARDAGKAVKGLVTMEQVARFYGLEVRHGFCRCPFHGETAGSLRIYPGFKGWHCFGCGRGGSVIDFVMQYEECDFRTAVWAMDQAFNLGLMDAPDVTHTEYRKRREEQKRRDETAAGILQGLRALDDAAEANIRGILAEEARIRDKPTEDMTADDYTRLLTAPDRMTACEDIITASAEMKRGVEEWRIQPRR